MPVSWGYMRAHYPLLMAPSRLEPHRPMHVDTCPKHMMRPSHLGGTLFRKLAPPPPPQKHFCIGTTLLFLLTRRMAAAVENVSTTIGTQVTPTTLPNFQMGRNMTWAKVPDLAWSANTFSIIKPKSVGDAHCMLSLDTPLHVYVCVSSKGEHVRTARSTKCHTLYGSPSQTIYGTHTPAVSVPSSESLPPLTPSWSRGRSILETHRTPASRCSWGWTPGQPPT